MAPIIPLGPPETGGAVRVSAPIWKPGGGSRPCLSPLSAEGPGGLGAYWTGVPAGGSSWSGRAGARNVACSLVPSRDRKAAWPTKGGSPF